MGIVQLPDHLRAIIDAQISAGRAANEGAFLENAVRRYAADLEAEDDVIAAAEMGIADIEAGRYRPISSDADMQRLRDELSASLDEREAQHRQG
jgi:Arc/MetJ-type ribon-helix-helix transcriptional regulator